MTLQAELDLLRRIERNIPAASDAQGNHIVIAAAASGDNTLIVPPGRKIEILELFLWNGAAEQTIVLKDGAQTLLQLTAMPKQSGLMLGFAGNGAPHFTVRAGNPLILNLAGANAVDGFVKYRLAD